MKVFHPRSTGLCAAVALAICAAPALATIHYSVRPLPESKQLAVSITIPTTSSDTLLQGARWEPGFYALQDYGKNFKEVSAAGPEGKPLPVETVDDYTWKVRGAGPITVSYRAPLDFQNGSGHYSGAPSYMYVVGRTQEPCTLHIDCPRDWKIAIGLDGGGEDYRAPTYDVLADNPVTLGHFTEITFEAAGRPHIIAVRGAGADQIDLAELRKQCEFVAGMETDFMGGAPYRKYIFNLNVRAGGSGGGGLEHLSGTEISLSSKLTPRTAGLFAHEFFHLWNVKRIRSRVLGPFDYTQLPKTGALWWLEGVTEYYAQSLLCRYGWETPETYFTEAGRDIGNLRSQPDRLKVSPYDSSYRVGDANEGRGNSNGFGVSYYDDGFVAGLCLDIELLAHTDGKRSLDDVVHDLWRLCRNNQPGFPEDGIRTQLIAEGGADFGPLYDRWIMTPGELPVEQELARVGLEIETRPSSRPDIGFVARPDIEKGGMAVTDTKSAEIAAALPPGTIIRSINGRSLGGDNAMSVRRAYQAAVTGISAGSALDLSVMLPGSQSESKATIHAIALPITITGVKRVASPSPEQQRLLQILIEKHRK